MDFDELDALEEARAAEDAVTPAPAPVPAPAPAAQKFEPPARPGAAAGRVNGRAAAENGGKAAEEGTAAAPTVAVAEDVKPDEPSNTTTSSPAARNTAFDFDDLEDAEDEGPEEVAERSWEPVPEDVWKTLPSIHPKSRPTNMREFKAVVGEVCVGEYYGLEFPFTPQMLREMGAPWLTKAMHKAGTLDKRNEVVRFVNMDVKAEDVTEQDLESSKWGGAGIKVLLTVEYAQKGPNLPERMFIKLPHLYSGKNERFKNSVTSYGMDWFEVTWYNIFGGRFGNLPIRTPRMIFCDMARKTTNFINIIEMIPYGRSWKDEVKPGEFFPAPDKYRDWDLPGYGNELYYAHARTLARLFGWHKNIRNTTDQVENIFMDEGARMGFLSFFMRTGSAGPYNSPKRDEEFLKMLADPMFQPAIATMGFPPQAAGGFLEMCKEFITTSARHVLPKDLAEQKHLDKFFSECQEMSKYCCQMALYCKMVPEFFTITHPNAQVDNAWYWRDKEGVVQCGLLDWGGATHGAIPICIGNAWMGAEPAFMDEHEENLIRCFIEEYDKVTGFKFDFDDLYMHMKLAQVCVLYGCCANIGTLLRVMPKAKFKDIKSRKDDLIDHHFLARCYYVQIELFIAMWKKRNPYAQFQKFMRRTKLPKA